MLGETVSHYKILEKLGQGGMGEVYLAEDSRLGRKVALKFLAPELARDRESLVRFRNEARAAAELSHPNIATVYDFDKAAERPFLALEYVRGKTLKDCVRAGPLPIDDVLRIGKAIAAGLAEAHAHGIIHRDIKSANLMLTENDEVKILDFGLARRVDATQLTRPGTTLGTLDYMSPEQTRGEAVDERSDIWSLGVVLYECLTGRLPFVGEPTSILGQVQTAEPPPPTGLRTGIPLELEQLVLRCLQKDAGLRPQHADEIVAALNLLGRASTGPMRTGASLGEEPRSPTRTRLLRWALVAIAVSIGVGWFAFRDRNGRPPGLEDPARLVVLPFESIGESGAAAFESGLAEELTTALSKVRSLRVVGIESAMSFRESGLSPGEIARELHAQYVLTGSVRWSAADGTSLRIRVSSRLVDTADEEQVWGASSTREADDIFLIQTDIAAEVADALNLALTNDEQNELVTPPTRNARAYELYIQGQQIDRHSRGRESQVEAEALYSQAVELDPTFVQAWSSLSKVRSHLYFQGFDAAMAEPAHIAAERARAHGPESVGADLAFGYYHYWTRLELEKAERYFESAVEKAPFSARTLYALAFIRRRLGRFEEAYDLLRRAWDLDPRNASILHTLASTEQIMGRFEDAIAHKRLLLSLAPSPGLHWSLAGLHLQAGDTDRAADAFRTAVEGLGLEATLQLSPAHRRLWAFAPRMPDLFEGVDQLPIPKEDPDQAIATHFNCATVLEALGHAAAARTHYRAVLAAADTTLSDEPPGWLGHRDGLVGVAAARLGRSDQAIKFAERLETLASTTEDQMRVVWSRGNAARIYAFAGQRERAIDLLESIAGIPAGPTLREIEHDPAWLSFRGNARFEALLQRLSHETSG